jgi:hypothetical protein
MSDNLAALYHVPFNHWICVYLERAHACERRVVHSMLVHWPLLLTGPSEICMREVAFRHLYLNLARVFWTIHRADSLDIPHEVAGNELTRRMQFTLPKDDYTTSYDRWRLWWWIEQERLSMSFRTKNLEGTKLHFYVIFQVLDCPLGAESMEPLSIKFMRETRVEDEEEGIDYKKEVLIHEPLHFYRYPLQIHRFLTAFTTATEPYWKDKLPLPDRIKL